MFSKENKCYLLLVFCVLFTGITNIKAADNNDVKSVSDDGNSALSTKKTEDQVNQATNKIVNGGFTTSSKNYGDSQISLTKTAETNNSTYITINYKLSEGMNHLNIYAFDTCSDIDTDYIRTHNNVSNIDFNSSYYSIYPKETKGKLLIKVNNIDNEATLMVTDAADELKNYIDMNGTSDSKKNENTVFNKNYSINPVIAKINVNPNIGKKITDGDDANWTQYDYFAPQEGVSSDNTRSIVYSIGPATWYLYKLGSLTGDASHQSTTLSPGQANSNGEYGDTPNLGIADMAYGIKNGSDTKYITTAYGPTGGGEIPYTGKSSGGLLANIANKGGYLKTNGDSYAQHSLDKNMLVNSTDYGKDSALNTKGGNNSYQTLYKNGYFQDIPQSSVFKSYMKKLSNGHNAIKAEWTWNSGIYGKIQADLEMDPQDDGSIRVQATEKNIGNYDISDFVPLYNYDIDAASNIKSGSTWQGTEFKNGDETSMYSLGPGKGLYISPTDATTNDEYRFSIYTSVNGHSDNYAASSFVNGGTAIDANIRSKGDNLTSKTNSGFKSYSGTGDETKTTAAGGLLTNGTVDSGYTFKNQPITLKKGDSTGFAWGTGIEEITHPYAPTVRVTNPYTKNNPDIIDTSKITEDGTYNVDIDWHDFDSSSVDLYYSEDKEPTGTDWTSQGKKFATGTQTSSDMSAGVDHTVTHKLSYKDLVNSPGIGKTEDGKTIHELYYWGKDSSGLQSKAYSITFVAINQNPQIKITDPKNDLDNPYVSNWSNSDTSSDKINFKGSVRDPDSSKFKYLIYRVVDADDNTNIIVPETKFDENKVNSSKPNWEDWNVDVNYSGDKFETSNKDKTKIYRFEVAAVDDGGNESQVDRSYFKISDGSIRFVSLPDTIDFGNRNSAPSLNDNEDYTNSNVTGNLVVDNESKSDKYSIEYSFDGNMKDEKDDTISGANLKLNGESESALRNGFSDKGTKDLTSYVDSGKWILNITNSSSDPIQQMTKYKGTAKWTLINSI